jgi:serine/threonine protein kinase
MSITQRTTEQPSSAKPPCPRCNAPLPAHAAFCGSCGISLGHRPTSSLSPDDTDIKTLYRKTSLIRRRPHVSLYFALDTRLQRPVVLCDFDLTSLKPEAHAQVSKLIQEEYDFLKREHMPALVPVLDLKQDAEHLYLVAGQPDTERIPATRMQTLHHQLQSGVGLPTEQVALRWMSTLCHTIKQLHQQQIIVGELDPDILILSGDSADMQPLLMVSWLPFQARTLVPRSSILPGTTSYSAPEVLLWKTDSRSDIYSLGAILYLLLTGVVPDDATQRMQRRLRSPRELNPRIDPLVDEFVMRAMMLKQEERFQSAGAMENALAAILAETAQGEASSSLPTTQRNRHYQDGNETSDITIRLKPLPQSSLLHWQTAANAATEQRLQRPAELQQKLPTTPREVLQPPATPVPPATPLPPASTESQAGSEEAVPLVQRLKQRITGLLPAIRPQRAIPPTRRSASPRATQHLAPDETLLKQFQRMILGEQHHTTTAAAIIETPLRIQPQQAYTVRIHLTGRDTHWTKKASQHGGLSSLVQGELVYIEIRSALYQNFAYIVQQTAVHIAEEGFAAEVTIPMQPLSNGPNGRRDRLHIFFLDEHHRPLYEKPFVVELFISHLVQSGREGHNVLTIPL